MSRDPDLLYVTGKYWDRMFLVRYVHMVSRKASWANLTPFCVLILQAALLNMTFLKRKHSCIQNGAQESTNRESITQYVLIFSSGTA